VSKQWHKVSKQAVRREIDFFATRVAVHEKDQKLLLHILIIKSLASKYKERY
jgi:hypothetical protein